MMEASLILQLEQMELNIDNNRNWTTSCDYGGEGPKHDEEQHLEHFVYLALVPLPRLHQPVDTGKTLQRLHQSNGDTAEPMSPRRA